jgi:hypothetical protein
MWGSTPPKAMVARIKVSSSSSPRMASCRCLGVMRLTFRSLAAFCHGDTLANALAPVRFVPATYKRER